MLTVLGSPGVHTPARQLLRLMEVGLFSPTVFSPRVHALRLRWFSEKAVSSRQLFSVESVTRSECVCMCVCSASANVHVLGGGGRGGRGDMSSSNRPAVKLTGNGLTCEQSNLTAKTDLVKIES